MTTLTRLALFLALTFGCSLDRAGLEYALPGPPGADALPPGADGSQPGADAGQEAPGSPGEVGGEAISAEVGAEAGPADGGALEAVGADTYTGSCQPTVAWVAPANLAAVSHTGFDMTVSASSPAACGRTLSGVTFRAAWTDVTVSVLGAGPTSTARSPAWIGPWSPTSTLTPGIIATVTDSAGMTAMAIIHVRLD